MVCWNEWVKLVGNRELADYVSRGHVSRHAFRVTPRKYYTCPLLLWTFISLLAVSSSLAPCPTYLLQYRSLLSSFFSRFRNYANTTLDITPAPCRLLMKLEFSGREYFFVIESRLTFMTRIFVSLRIYLADYISLQLFCINRWYYRDYFELLCIICYHVYRIGETSFRSSVSLVLSGRVCSWRVRVGRRRSRHTCPALLEPMKYGNEV